MNSIDLMFLILLSGIILLVFLGYMRQSQFSILASWVIALLSSVSAFTLSVYVAVRYSSPKLVESALQTWYSLDSISIRMMYYLDPWSITLALISSSLTTLIVLFSKFYIEDDTHASRYYLFVTTFVFGMLLLVLTDSLFIMFFGWEMVGLCSWALIGHYFYKSGDQGEKAKLSGQKALVTTGFADIGFVLGMFYLIVNSYSLSLHDLLGSNALTSLIALSFFLAAMGKSAQFPLHIWISSTDTRDLDAMQGPTTVSALIHAATMVNAGVYLTARLIGIGVTDFVLQVILVIGTITVLFAGVCALGTFDVKRVLAYSTISQLGYMIAVLGGVGVTQFSSLWHLLNHAMFKALLFLSAGTLIHLTHSRDLRQLAGSLRKSKLLLVSFLIGFLSLSGFPLFSGFFSKDLIIEVLWEHENTRVYAWLLLIGALLTSAYSFRAFYYLVVKNNDNEGQNEENLRVPWSAQFVLITLTVLTLGSSVAYFTLRSWFEQANTVVSEEMIKASVVMILSTSIVLVGILMGWYSTRLSRFIPKQVHVLVREGFYIDHLLSWCSDITIHLLGKLAVRVQAGSIFWNLFQFTFIATGIGIFFYWVQIGGVF